MKIETYREQKKRHSDEFGKFEGLFWAFSDEQFWEGMRRLGLEKEKDETAKICSIGAGGYMLKTKVKEFNDLMKRHKEERKNRLKDEKNLIESLAYELSNHEYCITYDPTDALNALDLKKEDVSVEVLKKAINQSLGVRID